MVADRFHAHARQHTYRLTESLQCAGKSQRVDACSKHTHLIALHAVEATLCATQSAEDVSSADDDGYLYALLGDGQNLLGVLLQTLLINAVLLLAHQALA